MFWSKLARKWERKARPMSQPLEPPSNPFALLVAKFLNPDKREFNETIKQGAREVLGMTLEAVGKKLRREPEPENPNQPPEKQEE